MDHFTTPVLYIYIVKSCLNNMDHKKWEISRDLTIPKPQVTHRQFKRGEKFLAGPIPLSWLSKVSTLPGKALNVALALWFLKDVKRSHTVRLNGSTLREFGVKRQAGYRALIVLERVGVVSCSRAKGRCPIVTIIN